MKLGVTLLLLAGCGGPAFEATVLERPDAQSESAPDAPGEGGDPLEGGGDEKDAAPEREAGQETCAPVMHSDGIGQSWQDCVPLGTYDEQQALAACRSSGRSCAAVTCGGDAGAQAVCSACACWTFAGPYGAGSVYATTSCQDAGVEQHCGGGATWR